MQLVRDREKKLRELLKEAGLDRELRQVDVAESLGRPQSYVAKVESGERTLDFIEVLDYCKAVQLEATSLVKELS
jgi:transcriptional regulator with XRE-family HTH domain